MWTQSQVIANTSLSTHINDGPLLHHDGVISGRGHIGVFFARLLEDEDTFHGFR